MTNPTEPTNEQINERIAKMMGWIKDEPFWKVSDGGVVYYCSQGDRGWLKPWNPAEDWKHAMEAYRSCDAEHRWGIADAMIDILDFAPDERLNRAIGAILNQESLSRTLCLAMLQATEGESV
jgi:hypothetical protein